LLGRFNNASNKGIDIAGKKGQAILAADQGQVVYQGGGLRGYGQLIIIKHNADFLSAYAHCDRIYVKEGDVVKRAQKIADIGSSGTDRIKLHFEIRYRGNPVDPMTYLPRK
jgi:lipoprotein NlpD